MIKKRDNRGLSGNEFHIIDQFLELNEEYGSKLKFVRDSVTDTWQNARDFVIPYMTYDQNRCQELERTIIDLLNLHDERTRQNFNNKFSPEDRFILIASIWLHDIGMCPILKDFPLTNIIRNNKRIDKQTYSQEDIKNFKLISLIPLENNDFFKFLFKSGYQYRRIRKFCGRINRPNIPEKRR